LTVTYGEIHCHDVLIPCTAVHNTFVSNVLKMFT
jgi:hypothetical protein